MLRALTAVAVTATLATGHPAAAETALFLPEPTGRYAVGAKSLYLKDLSRADPWVGGPRELMLTLRYPAWTTGTRRAKYMTADESRLLLAGIPGVPPEILTTVRTNSFTDALPAPGRRPLVVLSPGYTKTRATLSTLSEELASAGYIVATVDHTYENTGMSFPDGRVATCASCDVPHDRAFWLKLEAGRAADVSFVLDELTRRYPMIDRNRIAMGGHSVGGISTIRAMLADRRIRAGIDIDGGSHEDKPTAELDRPFMFLGSEGSGPEQNTGWVNEWQRMTSWKRWLLVDGTRHASFTDVGLLGEQLGLAGGGPLPADRTAVITRAYVRAFYDLHLRGVPQPLLDEPSTQYPEVRFCTA
ncbi:alpha/beta hydrolase [Kibdelosporangium persicum]|uniref:Platelet-activating factor acetylhydrolase isoform II n=1 Tax=Kibdelosporangium persicum TaxID=2698649 RepID=A0ABX2FE64_9PSEU|nr:alpha/beta hydrolase [Kibdelosporangium persicum]NRN69121.1 Platelet-activating factor acetylhydrolase isoform II [Kibdelosporangium persicum]